MIPYNNHQCVLIDLILPRNSMIISRNLLPIVKQSRNLNHLQHHYLRKLSMTMKVCRVVLKIIEKDRLLIKRKASIWKTKRIVRIQITLISMKGKLLLIPICITNSWEKSQLRISFWFRNRIISRFCTRTKLLNLEDL